MASTSAVEQVKVPAADAHRRESDSSGAADVGVPELRNDVPPTSGPSAEKMRLSSLFTIIAAGAGLISDGCESSAMVPLAISNVTHRPKQ
jgi:hypothetical protein